MSKKIKRLGKQFEEVTKKYEEFRQSPENEAETKKEAYIHALDVLGHMYDIYKEGAGEVNHTKEEQDFLGLLEYRESVENVIRGNYDVEHDLLDDYVDLDDIDLEGAVKSPDSDKE